MMFWHSTSLRVRALLLGLLPASIIALSLSLYLVTTQLHDLEAGFNNRGRTLANEAAAVSLYGLFTQDPSILAISLNPIYSQADILGIQVEDNQRKILYEQHKHPNGKSNMDASIPVHFTTPVIYETLQSDIMDFPEPAHLNSTQELASMGYVTVTLDHQSMTEKREIIIRNSLLMLGLGLGATVIFALLLGRGVIYPIIRLTDAAELMRQGDLSVTVPEDSPGEIKELEATFNAMSSQIYQTHLSMQEEIDRATAELFETMEALEIQNVELDLAKKRAQKASKDKSYFLARMSHEIRTPMNGLVGFTQLLKKTQLTHEQLDLINTIELSANHLLKILNNVLDHTKLEYGEIEPVSAPFNIRKCIEEPVILFAPTAHEKGLELILMVYSDIPQHLVGDEVRIKQILVNLISNALKFTQKGHIIVRVMLDEESADFCRIALAVSDTGIGIEDKSQATLFDSFSQVSSATSLKYGGTGLGLSICKKLAETMGGSIAVESQPGEGSTFTVKLKLEKDRSVRPVELAAGFPGKRCLLSCQHDLVRYALRYQLAVLGFEVDENRPIELLRMSNKKPDLIIAAYTQAEERALRYDSSSLSVYKQVDAPLLILLSSNNPYDMAHVKPHERTWLAAKPLTIKALRQMLDKMLRGERQQHTYAPELLSANDKPLTGRKILVVDDNSINFSLMNKLLTGLGAEIIGAGTGRHAIELANQIAFHLILMDIHLPDMRGTDVILAIRKTSEHNLTTPAIGLTADILPSTQQEMAAAGIEAYLNKPINFDLLKETIHTLLAPRSSTAHTKQPSDSELGNPAPRAEGLAKRDLEQQLRTTGGNRQLADEMFRRLLNELPEQLASIKRMAEQGQWIELRELAHKLKGGACVCGVPALENCIEALESDCLENEVDSIPARVKELETEIAFLLTNYASSGNNPPPQQPKPSNTQET